ncbi:uncharacterized protein PG986_003655 [Apiospora aurea]|uniref:Uncharacterized protein n=1 Tax=Apiospora aurea TaxID=335848 RepID=A0ABR1QSH3_9PEZI
MSSQGGGPTRPESPWAKVYGASFKHDLGDGQSHSLLNPIFPRLHPVYYDDLPPESKEGKPDVDQVQYSWQRQLVDLGGISSYQLGPLNETLGAGIYGGHSARRYDQDQNRKLHEARLLDVKEDAWLDFLKKERWWELNEHSLVDTRQSNPIDRWNPQQNRVWDELRIILEFCNRTLTKLLEERDPWLDALLFGDIVYSDGSPVPQVSSKTSPRKDEPVWTFKYRSPAELPPRQEYVAQARDQLLRLTKDLLFGFREPACLEERSYEKEYEADKTTPWGQFWVAKDMKIAWNTRHMIFLNVASIARFGQACTILHELMHAIHKARVKDFNVNPAEEAYMGEEQIREMGMSFINHVFGGTLLGLKLPAVPPGQLQGQRITVTDQILEGQELMSAYNQTPRDGWDVLRYGNTSTPLALIPPFACASLFDQNYWESCVNAKGTGALRPARLIAWNGHVTHPIPQVDEFRDPLAAVIGALDARRKEVEARRIRSDPDTVLHVDIWNRSLWGHFHMRADITAFSKHHSRHQLGPCRRIARDRLSKAREGFRLISADRDVGQNLQGAYWVSFAIAYLMLASLPAKDLVGANNNPGNSVQRWRDPRDNTNRVQATWSRRQATVACEVGSVLGGNSRSLEHPLDYLKVYEIEIVDKLRNIASTHHANFVSLGGVPPFESNAAVANFPLPPWKTRDQGPAPQPSPAERFLLPIEISKEGLILIQAANAQGWLCYLVPASKSKEVRDVWVKTPYGKALPANDRVDKRVQELRAELRKSNPSGILIPWCQRTEVAEFDGDLEFLKSPAGKTDAATKAFQSPYQLDVDSTLIDQDLENSLRSFLCAHIKHDDTGTTFPKRGSLLSTEKELARHDCPGQAVDPSVLRDREQVSYLDHHPASDSILAQCGGRDITQYFHRNHNNQLLTDIDLGDAKHTIYEVGRLVPAQAAIRDDQFVLGDCVFALKDLNAAAPARRRWAGKVVTPEEWRVAAEASLFDDMHDRRGELAVAKYEGVARDPGAPQVFSREDLAAHDGTRSPPDDDFAWVASEGDRYVVYNISGTSGGRPTIKCRHAANHILHAIDLINFSRCFPKPPNPDREMEWKELAGKVITAPRETCQWLRTEASHRMIGELMEMSDGSD